MYEEQVGVGATTLITPRFRSASSLLRRVSTGSQTGGVGPPDRQEPRITAEVGPSMALLYVLPAVMMKLRTSLQSEIPFFC